MMTQNGRTDRSLNGFSMVTGWFVLVLILLFGGLSIALIALGAQAYRSVGQTAEENAHRRASVSYAVSRVQAYDTAGAVQVRRVDVDGVETDVLILAEEIDGERYETRLFCAEGALREQFVSAEYPLLEAEDGETIARLTGFEAGIEGRLLTMRFVHPDGTEDVMHAAVLSAGEDGR